MEIVLVSVFVVGYILIALEAKHKVDKAAIALIMGVLVWTILVLFGKDFEFAKNLDHENLHLIIEGKLTEHLGEVAGILFFLIGAMSIVEVVDMHNGFSIITDRIKTKKIVPLMWVVCLITFFLSSVLDNLTTTIVILSMLRSLIFDQKQRWLFAGMVVIAANAGGAWSPIGDVTTTMLWISGQVTAVETIRYVFLPSLVCLIVPLGILSFMLKGNIGNNEYEEKQAHDEAHLHISKRDKNIVFFTGIFGLLFVPVFKTYTHLPPYVGMMFSLGILWTVTELLHSKKADRHLLSVISGLRRVDLASVLFFLGVLLAIGGMEAAGSLGVLAEAFESILGNVYAINITIGIISSIVDNVPLVAATQGMYNYPTDDIFWQFLAYCAGTGGSILIIGSAAGVAAMGIERIPFGWYLKRLTFLALAGYFAGALTFYILHAVS